MLFLLASYAYEWLFKKGTQVDEKVRDILDIHRLILKYSITPRKLETLFLHFKKTTDFIINGLHNSPKLTNPHTLLGHTQVMIFQKNGFLFLINPF